ncbi:MAG TPA: hypothetical protein VIK71_11150 [Flavobacteriales bacterium]
MKKTLFHLMGTMLFVVLCLNLDAQDANAESQNERSPISVTLGGSYTMQRSIATNYYVIGFGLELPLSDDEDRTWFHSTNVINQAFINGIREIWNQEEAEQLYPLVYSSLAWTVQNKFRLGNRPGAINLFVNVGPEFSYFPVKDQYYGTIAGSARGELVLRFPQPFLGSKRGLDFGFNYVSSPFINNKYEKNDFAYRGVFVRLAY